MDFKNIIECVLKELGEVVPLPPTEAEYFANLESRLDQAFNMFSGGNDESAYRNARSCVSDIKCRPRDLSRYFRRQFLFGSSEKTGIFLSALLNKTLGSHERLEFDAEFNKEIFLRDLNDGVLTRDEAGSLIYDPPEWSRERKYGLPENLCSFLERGIVEIKGRVGVGAAQHLKSGAKVVFNGTTGAGAGSFLEGGEIDFRGYVPFGILRHMKSGYAAIRQFNPDSSERFVSGGGMVDSSCFGDHQEGGKIEVFCDVPQGFYNLLRWQSGGEQVFHKRVAGDGDSKIGYKKTGGEVLFKGDLTNVYLGYGMESGEIIVDGSVKSTNHDSMVSFGQKGGIIRIRGNVEGGVGGIEKSCGEVRIGGNVIGYIGGLEVRGLNVYVGGNVKGTVGAMTPYIFCEIRGNVYGDVGEGLGMSSYQPWAREGWKRSKINIRGNVEGKVGERTADADIYVDGKIKEVGRSEKTANIYQSGSNVTRKGFLSGLFGG